MLPRAVLPGLAPLLLVGQAIAEGAGSNATVLDRRRRYVRFPEGSVFSVVLSATLAVLDTGDAFTEAVSWQIDYDLSKETKGEENKAPMAGPMLKRRKRSDLYRRLEVIMSSVGMDGRACILRSLCEASQRLRRGGGIVQETLRILFTLPLERVLRHEPAKLRRYDAAHRRGLSGGDCGTVFPACPVSLLTMALGRT